MSIVYQIYYKLVALVNNPEFLRGFFDNRFYLILLVVILMRMKYNTYRSMWLSALVNIPGTMLHEMMHYLVGLFLNAAPCNFTLFPKKNEDGDYVMGSVSFRNVTFYNAVPSAMAAIMLGLSTPFKFFNSSSSARNPCLVKGNFSISITLINFC